MFVKTVTIKIDKEEILESLGPLDFVSIFVNHIVEITDEDLMKIHNFAGAIEYQKFVTAARDFAQRVEKYNDTKVHDSQAS